MQVYWSRGGGGGITPPNLGRSVNPISARGGGEIMPPLQFSDLPTAMHYVAGALHEISPLFPVCNMFLVLHNWAQAFLKSNTIFSCDCNCDFTRWFTQLFIVDRRCKDVPVYKLWVFLSWFMKLKLRLCEKASKLEKNLSLVLKKQQFLLSSVKTSVRFFQIFLAFPETPNFK